MGLENPPRSKYGRRSESPLKGLGAVIKGHCEESPE